MKGGGQAIGILSPSIKVLIGFFLDFNYCAIGGEKESFDVHVAPMVPMIRPVSGRETLSIQFRKKAHQLPQTEAR